MSGLSGSSANSLSRLYNPGSSASRANIPELSKAIRDFQKDERRRGQEGEQGGSDEEDDYEPMNPGVVALANIQNWDELKKVQLRSNEYSSSPKVSPQRSANGGATSPIKYSMVMKQKEVLGKRNSTPVNYRPVVIHPKPGIV